MGKVKEFLIFCIIFGAVAAAPCYDRVRWGPWLDRDNPSGNGDYETRSDEWRVCDNPTAIQCRIKATG